MSNGIQTILRKSWRPALLGVLVLLNYFAAKNLVLLASDLLRGDGSADRLSPAPLYEIFRIPSVHITRVRQAVGRTGSDFTQIYFPAQDLSHLQDAYDVEKTLDPWNRPTRVAPLLIAACAVTICKLSYGYACLIEMLFQTLVFYGALYWAFSACGLRKYFLFAALLIDLFLFVTPVGLSWFERGQFSLYLAAAYALLIVGLMKKQPAVIAVAAVLAFSKWTSFPAIFVILAVYLISSRTFAELKSHVLLVGIFAATTIGLLLLPMPFFQGTDLFLKGLFDQELNTAPWGISLLRYASRWIVKAMPVAAILLGAIISRTSRARAGWLIPYAAGVITIMLTYPTVAFEYGLPSLWGFLPLLLFWAREDGLQWDFPRMAVVLAFLAFMMTASFSTRLYPSRPFLVGVYVALSLILMLSPSLLTLWERLGGRPALSPQPS